MAKNFKIWTGIKIFFHVTNHFFFELLDKETRVILNNLDSTNYINANFVHVRNSFKYCRACSDKIRDL